MTARLARARRPLRAATLVAVVALVVTSWATTAAAQAQANGGKLTVAEQAAAVSMAARAKGMAGQYDACATMYLEAYKLDPKTLGYLYSAARCEQKGGKWSSSRAHYEAFLAAAPVGDPLIGRATRHLQDVKRSEAEAARAAEAEAAAKRRAAVAREAEEARRRAAAADARKVTPSPVLRKDAGDGAAWRRPVGWVGVALGVAAAGAGAWMVGSGRGDITTLDADLRDAKREVDGKIVGISYDDATARQDDAHRKIGVGSTLIGVGLLSGGLGAWLVWTSPSKRVSVRPIHRLRGLRVTMRV